MLCVGGVRPQLVPVLQRPTECRLSASCSSCTAVAVFPALVRSLAGLRQRGSAGPNMFCLNKSGSECAHAITHSIANNQTLKRRVDPWAAPRMRMHSARDKRLKVLRSVV